MTINKTHLHQLQKIKKTIEEEWEQFLLKIKINFILKDKALNNLISIKQYTKAYLMRKILQIIIIINNLKCKLNCLQNDINYFKKK